MKTLIIILFPLAFTFLGYTQDTTLVFEFAGVGFNDVSSNGEWVSGTDGTNAYLWSEATGLIFLGEGIAKGVSNSGRVVGQGVDSTLLLPNGTPVPVACYWDPDGTHHSLGQFLNIIPFDPTLYSHGNSISDDGNIIAGMGAYPDGTVEAFTWTADSGYVLYGMGLTNSKLNVISGSGNVLGGWGNYGIGGDRLPVVWNPEPFLIPPFGPYQGGEVEGLNYDGSIAYGETFGTQAYVPFYWTEATGAVNLTNINIYYPAYAFDGNEDASLIVGRIGPSPGQAYIWENGNGQYFKDWVLAHGSHISDGFIVAMANGISSDGKTICGWGALPGTFVSGVIVKIHSTVPVELTSFTASVVNESVQLSWITATETNNSGFEVQRQTGDQIWETLGFVSGRGTTSEPSRYNYIDNIICSGNYSYRLKQIDYDGRFEYSNIIEMVVNVVNEFVLDQNYPNPFNPGTTISFRLAVDSKVNLTIFNILGQEVVNLISTNMSVGQHQVNFDASSLNSGLYLYKLEAAGIDGTNFSDSKKMMLLK